MKLRKGKQFAHYHMTKCRNRDSTSGLSASSTFDLSVQSSLITLHLKIALVTYIKETLKKRLGEKGGQGHG